MPNPHRIWFHWVFWHINHYRLFNAKSSLSLSLFYYIYIYIYIKYIWFGLIEFFGISTIVGYLMPNSLAREVMVATSIKQGSSNELSSRYQRIYVNKTNEIHKRLNLLRLRWFLRGWVVGFDPSWRVLIERNKSVCGWPYIYSLVWFYGISTIVGYLMPNPFYTYILNI